MPRRRRGDDGLADMAGGQGPCVGCRCNRQTVPLQRCADSACVATFGGERRLSFTGALDAAYRQRLLQALDGGPCQWCRTRPITGDGEMRRCHRKPYRVDLGAPFGQRDGQRAGKRITGTGGVDHLDGRGRSVGDMYARDAPSLAHERPRCRQRGLPAVLEEGRPGASATCASASQISAGVMNCSLGSSCSAKVRPASAPCVRAWSIKAAFVTGKCNP